MENALRTNPLDLAGGTARVILNKVNSSNPSVLRGYLEVAGDRAQLIVANLSAKNISLQSGQDIALEGGQFAAQENLALAAGRNLTLAAPESTSTENQRLTISKKEIIGFGQQSLKTTRTEATVSPDVAQLSAKHVTLESNPTIKENGHEEAIH